MRFNLSVEAYPSVDSTVPHHSFLLSRAAIDMQAWTTASNQPDGGDWSPPITEVFDSKPD